MIQNQKMKMKIVKEILILNMREQLMKNVQNVHQNSEKFQYYQKLKYYQNYIKKSNI